MKANPIANILGGMDGAEVPGGCDECDAVQKIRMEASNLFHIDVMHEDDCPVLKSMEEGK